MLRRLLALAAMTTGVMAAVHVIDVGKGNHKFTPNQVNADVGDIISFHFYPLNHSVVRMDPETPCFPWETYRDDSPGWWSHFWPMDSAPKEPISWNITINDTQPLYFYCSAPDSCIKFKMVGAINPPNDTYINDVAALAAQAPYAMSPGDPFQAESGPAAPTTTPNTNTDDDDSGVTLSAGAIAGIAIGGVIALALIGLLFFFVGRKKKGTEVKEAAAATASSSPEDGLMGEHPPVYQDPRYSVLPVGAGGAGGHWDNKVGAPGGQAGMGVPMSEHPNRISELPDSRVYDPVEIYTPGPEDMPAHRR